MMVTMQGPLARSEILNIEQKPIGGEASGIPGATSNTSPIASGEEGSQQLILQVVKPLEIMKWIVR